jgi:fibronectin type 3 domain-containing protein
MDTSGNTSPMSPIVAVTTPKPPAAPAGFSAVPVSATKIGLSWSAAVSGGLPVQYYHVYRGSSAANISEIILVAQTSYTDKNLNPTTTYYYAVQASDTGGDLSPMSAIVRVTTPAAPSAPAGLLATPIATTKIKLTWSAAASGGLPIQNYRVSRGTTRNNLSQVAIVLLPMYTDPNGTPTTLYYYAVEAADTGGDLSPMSATVSATTLALPSAPTNLIATAISKTAVSLAWTAGPSGMPLSSYSIYRAGSSSGLVQIGQVAATKTAFTDYQLTAGTIYDYAVQAIDTGGNTSPMSAVVKVTTPQ